MSDKLDKNKPFDVVGQSELQFLIPIQRYTPVYYELREENYVKTLRRFYKLIETIQGQELRDSTRFLPDLIRKKEIFVIKHHQIETPAYNYRMNLRRC